MLSAAGDTKIIGGLVQAGKQAKGLKIAATTIEDRVSTLNGYYELKPDLSLTRIELPRQAEALAKAVAIPIITTPIVPTEPQLVPVNIENTMGQRNARI